MQDKFSAALAFADTPRDRSLFPAIITLCYITHSN